MNWTKTEPDLLTLVCGNAVGLIYILIGCCFLVHFIEFVYENFHDGKKRLTRKEGSLLIFIVWVLFGSWAWFQANMLKPNGYDVVVKLENAGIAVTIYGYSFISEA